ncbi:MAG: hypothetical protein ABIT20_16705 [Gemmatimonadaceae bacterium]
MNNCWVIPKNAPAGKRDVQHADKRELEDGGYAKYRIAVNEGEDRAEATVYVQDPTRKMSVAEWTKAAWGLFGAHTALEIFHPDGSIVEQ